MQPPSLLDESEGPILRFENNYRFLSNFWPAAVEHEGLSFPTVEHAYQASKTTDRETRRYIAQLRRPGLAKHFGNEILLRPDWDRIKRPIMAELVWKKFKNPSLGTLLLETGDRLLVEGNHHHDTYWGVFNGQGHNYLGKILMSVRHLLRVITEKDS